MLVRLTEELWPTSEAGQLELDHLARTIVTHKHSVLPPSCWQRSSVVGAWFQALSGADRDRWQRLFQKGQQAAATAYHAARPMVEVSRTTSWTKGRLSLEHARRLLERPLKVLLENREADWAFLICMMPRDERQRLQALHKDGLVEAEQGGGLEEMLKRVRALAHPSDNQTWIERLRFCVLYDRDADPEDRSRPSPRSDELRRTASDCRFPWRMPHHQLQKRAIENYLPTETVFGWWAQLPGDRADRRSRAEALKRLRSTRTQAADQLNMKRGLYGDLTRNVRQAIDVESRAIRDDDLDVLFRGLPDDIREGLTHGFPELAIPDVWRSKVRAEQFDRFVSGAERASVARMILEHV